MLPHIDIAAGLRPGVRIKLLEQDSPYYDEAEVGDYASGAESDDLASSSPVKKKQKQQQQWRAQERIGDCKVSTKYSPEICL